VFLFDAPPRGLVGAALGLEAFGPAGAHVVELSFAFRL